jgi:hypothetical protein
VAQGPYVGRHRRHLIGAELSAAHRWHGGAILFRLRHTVADYFRNRCVTAIAPQPMSAGEIGTQRRTGSIRAVATRTGRTADLTVLDPITQRNHFLRRACRNAKACDCVGVAGIGMSAFRWFGVIDTDFAGGRRCARTGGRRGAIGAWSAAVDDAIDPPAHIIGDVE